MTVLLCGSAIYCLAFILHLVFWRVRLPKRQARVLFYIFFGTLIISIIILRGCSTNSSIFGIKATIGLLEYLHISLFVFSLTFAYIITYGGIEVDSPSLVMTMKIAESGSNGLSKDAFDESLSDDILIKPRLRDLIRDNMAYIDGDKYHITPKGIRMTRIFIFYRRLLNIDRKGG